MHFSNYYLLKISQIAITKMLDRYCQKILLYDKFTNIINLFLKCIKKIKQQVM